MTLATGTIEYTLGSSPVTGCGLSYTTSELESALTRPIAEAVFDDKGTANLSNMLSSLPDTDFDQDNLKR
ncbi:MAG: hypothetical protein K8S18_19585, partial [Desulfobacula sp.]|nr:hypothetical protein [Desulfobacula sp.]